MDERFPKPQVNFRTYSGLFGVWNCFWVLVAVAAGVAGWRTPGWTGLVLFLLMYLIGALVLLGLLGYLGFWFTRLRFYSEQKPAYPKDGAGLWLAWALFAAIGWGVTILLICGFALFDPGAQYGGILVEIMDIGFNYLPIVSAFFLIAAGLSAVTRKLKRKLNNVRYGKSRNHQSTVKSGNLPPAKPTKRAAIRRTYTCRRTRVRVFRGRRSIQAKRVQIRWRGGVRV